jgi:hypothetical protein
MGVRGGLLAAAAAACAPSTSSLIDIGVAAVLMAFRLGSAVQSIARELSPAATPETNSWTLAVPGLTESDAQSLLDQLHTGMVAFVLSFFLFCPKA